MKTDEIKTGETYVAKISEKLVEVRVDEIRKNEGRKVGSIKIRASTSYFCTNLSTGRRVVIRSAAKFRCKANTLKTVQSRSKVQKEKDAAMTRGGQFSPPSIEDNVNTKYGKPSVSDTVLKAAAEGDRRATAVEGSLASKLTQKESSLPSHLVIEARAGTGKTTTLIEGLKLVKGLPTKFTPSPQQKEVWDAMAESRETAKTICFVAFNKSIADELRTRVPSGCEAMTMHGMGNRAVARAFGRLGDPASYRTDNIIEEITGRDIRELRKYKPEFLKATRDLVSLCKQNLVGFDTEKGGDLVITDEELDRLAGHYDVELNGSRREVFDLVPKVLVRAATGVAKDGFIDFDDMIWLPVVLNLPLSKYDVLLVDEAQDLNRCQQQLAIRAGRRLILCGDDRQAIYGFAGADADSLPRMKRLLGATAEGVRALPLTVTRRCGKAIVNEAKKIVPDFEAFETNGEGKISEAAYDTQGKGSNYRAEVQDGDMILCRVNAPLVSQCFRFIKEGRTANIQGRKIGEGLVTTVKKLNATDVVDLTAKLSDWLNSEVKKENAKRNPSEDRIINLQDRYECLLCFTEGATSVYEVLGKIETLFTDNRSSTGIRLSSIHRAKGLEARRVFFLMPEGAACPHPMARSAWQRGQEQNLLYVGITRAIEELTYVR